MAAPTPHLSDSSTGAVLVTGAGGFIGRHLVSRLADQGRAVTALDLREPADEALRAAARWVTGDIRDPSVRRRALEGVDLVFHMAAAHLQVNFPASFYEEVNVQAARELVGEAHAAGVRKFVHVSSVGAMGDTGPQPVDEGFLCRPEGLYGRTKLQGETAVLERGRELELDLTVVRPAWVYGPGCPRTAKLLRAVAKGRFLLVGGGRNYRHPVFIEDFLDGLDLAAGRGRALEVYLLAGPRPVTVRELGDAMARALGVPAPRWSAPLWAMSALAWSVELAARAAGREPPFSTRTLEFFRTHNAYDIGKARRELGFEPRVDLVEGFRRSLEGVSGTTKGRAAPSDRRGDCRSSLPSGDEGP